jgi:hypothetical protein
MPACSRVLVHPRQAGGELRLAAPEQLVLRLLSLTGLTGLLPVFASVDQAASVDQVGQVAKVTGPPLRPPGWLVSRRMVKHRRETVKFTAREMTHHLREQACCQARSRGIASDCWTSW